jgi:hypothetical protein
MLDLDSHHLFFFLLDIHGHATKKCNKKPSVEGEKQVGSNKRKLTDDLVAENKSQRPDRVDFNVPKDLSCILSALDD